MGCPPRLLDKALGAEFRGQTQGVTALNQVFERGRKIKQMFSFSTLQTLFDPPQLFLAQLVLIYSKKRKNLQGCQTSRFSVFWPKLEFFLRGRVMPRIFSDYTVNQHESKSQIKSGKSLAVGIYLIFYFLGGLFSADLIFFGVPLRAQDTQCVTQGPPPLRPLTQPPVPWGLRTRHQRTLYSRVPGLHIHSTTI